MIKVENKASRDPVSSTSPELEKVPSTVPLTTSVGQKALAHADGFETLPGSTPRAPLGTRSNSATDLTASEDVFSVKIEDLSNRNSTILENSCRLKQDMVISVRGPKCNKAVAVGGMVKHAGYGFVKIALLPVSLLGTPIYAARKLLRKDKKLAVEKTLTAINNLSEQFKKCEKDLEATVSYLSSDKGGYDARWKNEYSKILFTKMVKLYEDFIVKFEKHCKETHSVKKANVKYTLLSRELTKLIEKERKILTQTGRNVPNTPINITHQVSKSLIRWIELNKQLNGIYKNKAREIFWRRIPAILEQSLTIHGPAISFLRAGIHYKSLTTHQSFEEESFEKEATAEGRKAKKRTVLDSPIALTVLRRDTEELTSLFPAETTKKHLLRSFRGGAEVDSSSKKGEETITIKKDTREENLLRTAYIMDATKKRTAAEDAAERAAEAAERAAEAAEDAENATVAAARAAEAAEAADRAAEAAGIAKTGIAADSAARAAKAAERAERAARSAAPAAAVPYNAVAASVVIEIPEGKSDE